MIRCEWIRTILFGCFAVVLSACGGGGGGDDGGGSPPPPPTFTVGGTITGLTQGSVTLRLNGANDLIVNGNASGSVSFTFSGARLASGTGYTVGITLQPNSTTAPVVLVCGPNVTNGSGTMGSANVTNVTIACASYSLNGTLSGLKAGSQLRLMINGDTRQHVLAANGAFTFPSSVTFGIGAVYVVHIMNQPAGQTCLLEGSIGLIRATDPNPATIAIVCDDNVTDVLSGTYQITEYNGQSAEVLEFRNFITFYSDGTFIFGIHEGDNPDCGPNGQGGVQYGVYNWDDTTHVFRVVRLIKYSGTAPLECGLDETTNLKLAKRSNGSVLLVDEVEGDYIVLTPVPSTTGELTGSFGDNQYFIAFAADGKFFSADTRAFAASHVPGNPVGYEDGCYALTGASRVTGSFTVNATATCAVSATQSGIDTNGASFGMSPFSTQPRTFTVTGDAIDLALVVGQQAVFRAMRIPVAPTAVSTFSVSGTITGLTGASGTTLRLNGQTGGEFNAFRPAGSTTFTFAARLESGASYGVGVPPHAQPTGPTQFCRPAAAGPGIESSAGTIFASDVTTAQIICSNSAAYTVTGNVTGLAGGAQLTLRGRYFDVTAGGEGAFATVDRIVAANGLYGTIAIPANVGVFLGILQQPPGQTCTIVRGTAFSVGTAIANADVVCVNNVTSSLTGTYSFLDSDGRGYANFNADGTVTTALIHRDPDPANTEPPADCTIGDPAIDQRNGNGVEYGVFSRNQSTGATQLFAPPAVDTNGDCGFWEPGISPPSPWAILTRAGNNLTLQSPPGSLDPFSVTAAAVLAVPGSVVGSWVPEANNGTVLVFHADGTFMFADTQNIFLFPAGYGQERGCYTVAGTNITLSIAASCRPDGHAAYDLNAVGGAFANGAGITVTSIGPLAFTLNNDTLEFLGRVFKRSQPN